MTLSELIAHVGDEHVLIQNLDNDADGCEVRGGVGRFTFRTDPQHVIDRMRQGAPTHTALVLWLPKERLPNDFS